MQTRGVPLVVLAALCLVLNAGVSRVVLRAGVDAGLLTTVRITGTVVLLVLAALVVRRSALVPPRGRLLVLLVVHGAVGVAALQWTYFVSVDRLPVSLALLLEYQAPVIVALWARVVQRESVRPRLWWGLALAVVGLAAATEVWRGARFDLVGVLAGVGAALTFSAYFLIGEAGVGSLDPVRVMIWSFLVAAVVMNLLAPLSGLSPSLLGRSVSLLGTLDGLSVPVWTAVVWVVLGGTLVPFGLILLALTTTPATTVTMTAMLEPVGVSVLGWVWFKETLGPVAVAGVVAVVVGILLAQSARRSHLHTEPPSLT